MEMISGRALWLALAALALATCGPALRADDVGELFPGVKGVSGDELKRQIEDYDRTHQSTPAESPKTAPGDNTPKTVPPPATPANPPLQPVAGTAPATPPASATLAAMGASSLNVPPSSASPAAVARPPGLKKLAEQTKLVEDYLKKAKVIRDAARAEAVRDDGSEARNQYNLRYFSEQIHSGKFPAPNALKYEQALLFPSTMYRYVYTLAEDQAKTAKTLAAALQAQPEQKQAAEDLAKRLRVVRKGALLGAAEVYTLLRRLDIAEKIYNLLLKDYPDDAGLKASYEQFVAVRDNPDLPPSPTPPGGSGGGGGGGGGRGGRR
jgi:tetratricopeptide (TPR) repeat protein